MKPSTKKVLGEIAMWVVLFVAIVAAQQLGYHEGFAAAMKYNIRLAVSPM